MPSLIATLGLNGSQFRAELDNSVTAAQVAGQRIMKSLNPSLAAKSSTIFNSREAKAAGESYADWWGKTLLERDIEAARRGNEARRLLRRRAAAQEASEAAAAAQKTAEDVEAASRRNLARRLWRQRKENRENGGGGNHGAMREAMVLVRELARGDFKRAGQSASILLDKLGLMKYVLNPITGAVLGLAAGFLAAYKLTVSLSEKLSGLKMPEFHPEYIPKHLQKLGQIQEAHREIGKEIERTIELYNSAARAAERLAEHTKNQFEHQRRMNQLNEEYELENATTERQKQFIRQKYSAMDLQLTKQEHTANIKAMEDEKSALEKESAAKSEEADKLAKSMPSKAADENTMRDRKQQADEAEKYLQAEITLKNAAASKEEKEKAKEIVKPMGWAMRAYNAVAASGVSNAEIDAAMKATHEEAQRRVKAYDSFQDEAHGRDVQRERADQLNKDAGAAAQRATELGLKIPDQKKEYEQQEKDQAEEAAARLRAQRGGGERLFEANSLQKIGAFNATPPMEDASLTVQKQNGEYLREMRDGIQVLVSRPPNGVRFS